MTLISVYRIAQILNKSRNKNKQFYGKRKRYGKKLLLSGADGHSKVVETINVLEKKGIIEPYDAIDYLDDASSKAVRKFENQMS